ncbi:hypothetical protein KBB49_00215 [Candidatus Saccharibacteria bacterium]|jgi:hypothetical protein|nr:hypothetical protein [Candidatus Saccharibacteria bacterium]
MNQLLGLDGSNPIAFVGANFVNKQTGYDGDYNINQTSFRRQTYPRIYTLGDLYTQLALADQEVVAVLEHGPYRDVGSDYLIATATEQATVVFGSMWTGLRSLSIGHSVSRQQRRGPRSWIDEVVSDFEIEQAKTSRIKRRRIAGSIGYIV